MKKKFEAQLLANKKLKEKKIKEQKYNPIKVEKTQPESTYVSMKSLWPNCYIE